MGASSSKLKPHERGIVSAPLGVDLTWFQPVSSSHFMTIIGKGGFGSVSVMQYKGDPRVSTTELVVPSASSKDEPEDTRASETAAGPRSMELFAVKSMNKAKLVARENVQNALNELRILSRLPRHRGVVNVYYAFQDETNLYAALDLCLGGSLYHLLEQTIPIPSGTNSPASSTTTFSSSNKPVGLPYTHVKRYAAELLMVLDFFHRERIVHRDIKPDNILIDARGRLRVTDFNVSMWLPKGSAEKMDHREGWGTKGYRAPEIYVRKGGGHRFACDWFSLGVTLYEILTGKLPFEQTIHEKDVVAMLKRIMAQEFDKLAVINACARKLPDDLDEERGEEEGLVEGRAMLDFLERLLRFDPATRLVSLAECKKLAVFKDTDWEGIESGTVKALWTPVAETDANAARLLHPRPVDLAKFAKNFDTTLDEQNRMQDMRLNLAAAGFSPPSEDGRHPDEELEGLETLPPSQQVYFRNWSFNRYASKDLNPDLGEDRDVQVAQLPTFGLLQTVAGLKTPQEIRDFVAKADDQALLRLGQDMRAVHEALLEENFKFINAELRCAAFAAAASEAASGGEKVELEQVLSSNNQTPGDSAVPSNPFAPDEGQADSDGGGRKGEEPRPASINAPADTNASRDVAVPSNPFAPDVVSESEPALNSSAGAAETSSVPESSQVSGAEEPEEDSAETHAEEEAVEHEKEEAETVEATSEPKDVDV